MIKAIKQYKYLAATLGLATLLLGGCATTPQMVNNSPIEHWSMAGKIAIVYPAKSCNRENCPKQSDQGKVQWQQNKKQYHIVLFDPFGRKVIGIEGNDNVLQASTPGKAPIQATPAEFVTLLTKQRSQSALFADLRPQDLRYWVTGRAVPNTEKTDKGSDAFIQKGFTITNRQWRETSLGYLPSLVTVVKDQLKLRLVIKHWDKQ